MRATTPAIISVATALFVTACVMLEDRIARVTTPEIAAAAITASCVGGHEFVVAATASLDKTAAAILTKGVEAACALRSERTPISATVFDRPIDQFCHEALLLIPGEADERTREIFNTQHAKLCEAQE